MQLHLESVDLLKLDYAASNGLVQLAIREPATSIMLYVQCQNIRFLGISGAPGCFCGPYVVNIMTRSYSGDDAIRALLLAGYGRHCTSVPEELHHLRIDGEFVADIFTETEFIVMG